MATFKVFGIFHGSKYLGEVEADSATQAMDKAWDLESCHIRLCHQCAEIDIDEISEIEAEPA